MVRRTKTTPKNAGTRASGEAQNTSLYTLLIFGLVFATLGIYLLASSFAATSTGTFGKTNIGATCDTYTNDTKKVNRYSVGVTATVTQLSVYLKPGSASGSQPLKGVLYADSGGSPRALIASTAQLTFTNLKPAGWYSLVFNSPPTVGAGNYWIGVITGNTARVIGYCYDSVAGARDYNNNTFTSGPSNPFGTPSTDDRVMSLYATYTYTTASPPTASLAADPSSITDGQSSTLSWSSSNASFCVAPWTGSTATSGTAVVAPSSTTLYEITCTGSGGSATAQATLTVDSASPPPSPTPPPPDPSSSPSPPPQNSGNDSSSAGTGTSQSPDSSAGSGSDTSQGSVTQSTQPNNAYGQKQQLYLQSPKKTWTWQKVLTHVGGGVLAILLGAAALTGAARIIRNRRAANLIEKNEDFILDHSGLPPPVDSTDAFSDIPPFPFL